jgi:3-hydroxyacyl-CoA dehydrogenase
VKPMAANIRTAAVLGAGTMGAQIAAHLANAGVPTLLLDVTPQAAQDGLKRARDIKPEAFFTPAAAALVTTGGFDDGLPAIAKTDWIIEAVVERLDVKQSLFERVERHLADGAVVSSNTSGIPIGALADGRSDRFRKRFLGTHFFNPPRYLQLVEVIPTPDTDPAVTTSISRFADWRLGKGVVLAKDTPNFIANHLGLFGVMQIFRALPNFTIEEIDAITGRALGRPKSATFRTMDIAGIDVLAHVARNLAERLEEERDREVFRLPPVVEALIARGSLGAKSGEGFYKKDASGEILTLDVPTLTYRAKQPARFPSIEAAKSNDDAATRLRTLFLGKDRVGEFLRDTLGPTLVYAARVAPQIAHSTDDVDRAMQWGFGWELGPFETWDAIGVKDVVEALNVTDPPPLVREALDRGAFRSAVRLKPDTTSQVRLKADTTTSLEVASGFSRTSEVVSGFSRTPPAQRDYQILRTAKEQNRVVRKNAGASLVDLGDGVLCVEFHSKMNALGGDAIQMLQAGVREAAANHAALVVGNEAPHFSAGANLMLLLLEAQEGNWEDVDLMVRAFQAATMGLKYADVPVVVAPGGLTLGGGCEIVLHADRVQAAAESYIGLVEVGVGLIPAGGGTKEMLLRATGGQAGDLLPTVQRVFETIGFAKVSTSAADARRLGFTRDVDAVTMNRERLLSDAKAVALERAARYVTPQPPAAIRVGGAGLLAALKLGVHLAWRAGRISDHDALIGRKLAWILAGGDAPHETTVTEQQLLDLEREAFLSLCGERKTQERIAYTLKTGKMLRN